MNSTLVLITAAAAGLIAGVIFFGGLYLTTRAVSKARRPAFLVLGSFLLRSATVAGGAWFVAESAGVAGLALYLGMLIAVRIVAVHTTRRRYETNA